MANLFCIFNLQCRAWVQGGLYVSSHQCCILFKQRIQIKPYKYKLNVFRDILKVASFLLFQQTAVQSTILILIRTANKILQTCSVVKSSAATIQKDMAVSDSDA